MPNLRTVAMGPVDERRIVGYVDDLGGVYNAQRGRIGGVGIERNARYAVQDVSGVVVGSVDSQSDASGGHAVYDAFNVVVGTAFGNTFVETATGQAGLIAFDEGQGERRELICGAALLLLVHAPVIPSGTGPQAEAFTRMAQGGAHLAHEGIHHLKEDHQRTLAERERLAKSGSIVDGSAGQVVKFAATTVLEMIPLGLGPWGIGDVTTFIECLLGRTIDGLKLSMFERLIYLGASAIPVVPARPVVTVYRLIERSRAHQAAGKTGVPDLPSVADLNPVVDASRPAGYLDAARPGDLPPSN